MIFYTQIFGETKDMTLPLQKIQLTSHSRGPLSDKTYKIMRCDKFLQSHILLCVGLGGWSDWNKERDLFNRV